MTEGEQVYESISVCTEVKQQKKGECANMTTSISTIHATCAHLFLLVPQFLYHRLPSLMSTGAQSTNEHKLKKISLMQQHAHT